MVKVRENLVGKIFGRLTVVQQADDYIDSKGIHYARWLCECSCPEHNTVVVHQCSLKQGNVISCGCIKKELTMIMGQNNKKYNEYDLSGEYGIGYTLKGEEFWFDLEDYDKIKDYCWYYTNSGYVSTIIYPDKEQIFLHCLVMNSTKESFIDHINHPYGNQHKVDNRKGNLRFVTDSQNQMNKCIQTNNTSGYTGVNWNQSTQSWVARISIDNKRIYLGSYSNLMDAVNVRKQAEIKYFGNYRYNSGSSKAKKAAELRTPVMSEAEFIKMIGE